MRQRTRQVEVFKDPVVKRAVHLEFQRADTVGDALDVIAQAMGEIVHRVNAPLVARVMVRGMADAVEQRVAQPDVGRSHVDLRTQCPLAVGELAVLHAREQIEALLNGAVAKRTVFAGFVGRAAVQIRFLGREVADVGFTPLDQFDGPFINLVEIVGGVERFHQ